MKRLKIGISLLVLASMALAACSTNANTTPGTAGTPGAAETLPASGLETATADLPMATEVATSDIPMETATPAAAAATEVPMATETVEGTGTTGAMNELTTPYRLSQVTDKDVVTQDGEDLGEIERLVINPDGTIRYAVLKTGEFLGMGGKSLLVPWMAFKPFTIEREALAEDNLVLNTTEDALTGAPTLDDDNFDFADVNWDENVVAYWSSQNLTVPVTGVDAAMGMPVVVDGDLGDVNVVNAQGEDLGEIEDFIINPDTGKINHAVFDFGGFLGVGERKIPVAWSALQWNPDDEVVININKDALNMAPYFDDWDSFDLTAPDFSKEWDAFWSQYPMTTP